MREKAPKTMLEDLKSKYPDVRTNVRGIPKFLCPPHLGYNADYYCEGKNKNCIKCWNRPFEQRETNERLLIDKVETLNLLDSFADHLIANKEEEKAYMALCCMKLIDVCMQREEFVKGKDAL